MGYQDLNYKPKILKKKLSGIDVYPSDSIYFQKYAYKAEFDADIFENRRQRVHFKRQMEDFEWDLCKGGLRSYVAHNGVRVYLRSYDDLVTLTNLFHSQIKWISGPRSAEHVKLMTSADYFAVLRDKLYYEKYDCKVWLSNIIWNKSIWSMPKGRFIGSFPRPRKTFDQDEIEKQIKWFQDSVKTFRRHHNWGYGSTEFYCDYAEFTEALPFFKIQWPEHRMVVRKVLLKDKY